MPGVLGAGIWSGAGSAAAIGIVTLLMMLSSRLLGKSEFGVLVFLHVTIVTLGILLGAGIGIVATRYLAVSNHDSRASAGGVIAITEIMVFVSSLVVLIVMLVWAESIAEYLLRRPDLGQLLRMSSPAILFLALDSFYRCVLTGLVGSKQYASATVIGGSLFALTMVWCVSTQSMEFMAGGLVVASFLQMLPSLMLANAMLRRHNVVRDYSGATRSWALTTHYIAPAMLSVGLVGPAHWLTQSLLMRTPGGAREVATFGIVLQLFNIATFVPTIAGRVLLPEFAGRASPSSVSGHSVGVARWMWLCGAATLIVALSMALLSPLLLALYGRGADTPVLPLILGLLAAVPMAIPVPVGALLTARGKLWTAATFNLIWAVTYIGFAIALSPKGAVGAASALLIAFLVYAMVVCVVGSRSGLWREVVGVHDGRR